jgi:NitT/TauT family transport system ATP-binding protein
MDIVVNGIGKCFEDECVLSGFSAVFKQGEVSCIMGPSGCGKTTLLNILMGLMPPDVGSVEGVPRLKSAVFQEDRLCEEFNALSNIRLVAGPEKICDEEILGHLSAIGLVEELDKPVGEFSGGMKRRVAIVRSILAESDILFFDEPFKGLDDATRDRAIDYVKNNLNGRTLIMVTHSGEECRRMGGGLVRVECFGRKNEN